MKKKPYRLDVPPGTKLPPALRRLVEEVRNEKALPVDLVGRTAGQRYDRIHNRHNRSS